MAQHTLVMALAKVIIAAAWADGHLAEDEVNHLKRLLLRMPSLGSGPEGRLTAEEWTELDIYLHSPVGQAERTRLITELRAALSSQHDREIALQTIEELIAADRVVMPEEQKALAEIRQALEGTDLGLFAQFGRLFRGPSRSAPGPNRELLRDDFIKNRIYFAVRQRLNLEPDTDLGLDEEEARTLSLAGGMLARVITIDSQVLPIERSAIEQALRDGWGIAPAAAALVTEVALSEVAAGLDFYQLTYAYAMRTGVEERVRFLDALFAVAAADGEVSSAENEEISRITHSIRLTHDDFVAARQRAR